jgi:hypothetical protein
MVKITINVDDDLWRLFSLIVMHERRRGRGMKLLLS